MPKRMNGIPFENTQIKPQYDYTPEMYAEDKRIARWFIFTKCQNIHFEKSITKEDLLQWCLVRLWQGRPRYDPSKSKYTTWACQVCKSTVFYTPLLRQNKLDNDRDDLDRVLAVNEHGEKYSLIDTICQDDNEIQATELVQVIYQAIDRIKQKRHRERTKQYIDLMLKEKLNAKQAADKLGISRQAVSLEVMLVRKIALRLLQEKREQII